MQSAPNWAKFKA